MTRALALAWLLALLCACSEPADEQASGVHERIVALAPNLTELAFAVGAGDSIVGVSAWSDYPAEARELPVVGDAFSIDQEQLALLEPDLVLVWESGTPAHTVENLRKTGYEVAVIRTRGLADISRAMLRIGALTGRSTAAAVAAAKFDRKLQALREQHEDVASIDVFYQVSARPLYTVNREHYISELIDLCGGKNIFDDLSDLAPGVSVEAVVERDPEVMLASTDAGSDGFAEWQRWPAMAANRYRNQFLLPADELARATPRVAFAGAAICLALEQARSNRDSSVISQDPGSDRGPTTLPSRRRDVQERGQ